MNQGFIIVVKSCTSGLSKIYGSVINPLYFTGSFVDDSEHKGYELTFEQTFADDTPVLFYGGNILVDEDALDTSDPEYSSLFIRLDGSNITGDNRELLRSKLGVGLSSSEVEALVIEFLKKVPNVTGNVSYNKILAKDKSGNIGWIDK